MAPTIVQATPRASETSEQIGTIAIHLGCGPLVVSTSHPTPSTMATSSASTPSQSRPSGIRGDRAAVVAFLCGDAMEVEQPTKFRCEWPGDYAMEKMADGQFTCWADHVWAANAMLALRGRPLESPIGTPGVMSFKLFRLPENLAHDGPILGMDAVALYMTAESMMWKLDGDMYGEDERSVAWFNEFWQMFGLIERRAQILATNRASVDHVPEGEYRARPPPKKEARPRVDSDDESDEEEIIDVGPERIAHTSLAFVFDVHSVLEHCGTMVKRHGELRLGESPEFDRLELQRLRERTITETKRLPIKSTINFFMGYMHALELNACDRRLYARRMYLHANPPSYSILAQKQGFHARQRNPPVVFKDLLSRTGKAYRHDLDALFHLWAEQDLDNVCSAVTWKDWWRKKDPPDVPCIVRLAARGTWGVAGVEEWPRVFECASFCEAFVVLTKEAKQLDLDSYRSLAACPEAGYPSKRVRVGF